MATQTGLSRHEKRVAIIAAAIVLPLIILWFSLSALATHFVNMHLAEMQSYRGSVKRVELHLLRGAYQIVEMELQKLDGKVPVPFFKAKTIDISLDWRALLHRALVGRIAIEDGELNFVDAKNKSEQQNGTDENWQQFIKDFSPLRINRFEVHHSKIFFRNFSTEPKVHLFLNDVDIVATNLTNSLKLSETLVSRIDFSAKAMNQAPVEGVLHIDPLADRPPFQLSAKLSKLKLTELNKFALAYAASQSGNGTRTGSLRS